MLLNIHCLRRWHWNSETLCSLVFLCLIIPWAGDVLCMRARPYCMQYMEDEDEEFARYRLYVHIIQNFVGSTEQTTCLQRDLQKCDHFWGVNNFWPSISWQETLKMAGHPELNDKKKGPSLIFWSLVAIKTGHETAASPWHHNDILNIVALSIW